MVRLQKSTKQKKTKASSRFPNKSNQNWNKSSYSSMYGQNKSNNYRPAYTNQPTNYSNRQPLRPAGDRNNNNNNNNNYQNYQKKSQQSQPIQQKSQQSNRPNMVRSSSSSDGNNFSSDNWRAPVVKENTSNNYSYSNGKSTGTFSMPEDMRNRLAANKSQQDKREEQPVRPPAADDLRNKLNAARSNQEEDLRSRLISKMNNAIQTNVPKPQSVVKQDQVPRTIDLTSQVKGQTQQQQRLSIANRLSINSRIASSTPPAVNRSFSSGSLTPQNDTNLTVIKDYQQYQVSWSSLYVTGLKVEVDDNWFSDSLIVNGL